MCGGGRAHGRVIRSRTPLVGPLVHGFADPGNISLWRIRTGRRRRRTSPEQPPAETPAPAVQAAAAPRAPGRQPRQPGRDPARVVAGWDVRRLRSGGELLDQADSRRAWRLGGRPLYIETVPQAGARFIAPDGLAAGRAPPAVLFPGATGIRLEKALWTNIAELRLSEARRRVTLANARRRSRWSCSCLVLLVCRCSADPSSLIARIGTNMSPCAEAAACALAAAVISFGLAAAGAPRARRTDGADRT